MLTQLVIVSSILMLCIFEGLVRSYMVVTTGMQTVKGTRNDDKRVF